ncbi:MULTISPECIES: methionine--tRNA ligase [Bosea]|uniref:methionine--tRNA ligase n=1 Tax=Bosea TaxID=85413 RepID=UPI00215025EB|nr:MULTISPECIES: methionine--tRNA ligase [Bosea]MCR4521691.1 methionine--tRNA ligase [Bosea sp. 47.2.35]MDR6827213.1 methionyl-tRNA synthetase [Bosea robiniae]MDR6893923.1 methionyl-tRNA synthetase [Bosea sp. BE109]MDR7137318.1 methionyl-tRNA synthetase [Bosea sp. BE168]MDR7174018.1 methionyl-tRNA synthetase [Bosea sp. BE271]
MATAPKFYLTTAIHYTNGPPHIGHAYEMVAADAIARFKRLDGYDVFAMTGTDEHGQKVQRTAAQNGLSPKEFVDKIAARFEEMEQRLGCSFDRFIRTTDADHKVSTDELWRRMEANGDIYLAKYAGWYSVRDEAFYGEEETTLQPDGTRLGGQGTPVEWVEEESYFFRLKSYQDRLLKLYEDVPDFISPETRKNEVVSFVKGGLEDLSISRTTFDWGLPVPGDPKHVMYVWVDALNNYVTGTGFPDPASPRAHYWPADVHIIGKDIVRFHAVYWPAFLMSAGLPLPKRVFGHGFLLNKGTKMSKSLGNVVDPFGLAETYGVDQLRYFFLREVSFGQDGNYSHDAIVGRINADLANDLGNLAQRSLSMIAKNCEGRVPPRGALNEADEAMLAMADAALARAREAMKDFALHTVLADLWALIAEANRYFANNEPWRLTKTDPSRRDTILYVTIEVLREVAILVQPVMPVAAGRLLDLLGVAPEARSFAALGAEHRLVSGAALPAPSAIFPRYVEPEDDQAA